MGINSLEINIENLEVKLVESIDEINPDIIGNVRVGDFDENDRYDIKLKRGKKQVILVDASKELLIKYLRELYELNIDIYVARSIENFGNYVVFSPEFSNGQFLKTSNTINRIVHNENIRELSEEITC